MGERAKLMDSLDLKRHTKLLMEYHRRLRTQIGTILNEFGLEFNILIKGSNDYRFKSATEWLIVFNTDEDLQFFNLAVKGSLNDRLPKYWSCCYEYSYEFLSQTELA